MVLKDAFSRITKALKESKLNNLLKLKNFVYLKKKLQLKSTLKL